MATTPAWVWFAFLGWFGTYVAYPIWAISMGMVEGGLAGRVRMARAGTAVID